MFRPHTSTIQSRHDLRLHGGVEAGAKASSRSRWCGCAENIHERKEEVDDMEDWNGKEEETKRLLYQMMEWLDVQKN